jgi:hypothetical protein
VRGFSLKGVYCCERGELRVSPKAKRICALCRVCMSLSLSSSERAGAKV